MVPVVGPGPLDEPVVEVVEDRRAQDAIQPEDSRPLVVLVLVAAAARDLDDDLDQIGERRQWLGHARNDTATSTRPATVATARRLERRDHRPDTPTSEPPCSVGAHGPADRHGHLPRHRRRGLDPAAPRARARRLRAGARRAPPDRPAACRPARRRSRSTRRATRSWWRSRSPTARSAPRATLTERLAGGPILVRVGLHTGTPLARPMRATSARSSTWRHGSHRRPTAARSSLSDSDARPTSTARWS